MSDVGQRAAGRTPGLVLALAWKSLWNRRLTAALTLLSVATSVALLVGVERIRSEAKAGFANTISGADLIIGARGGPLNLVLYSIFRMGEATNNISWDSYQAIAARPEVAWTIPLSLGDAHRGYRVLGTDANYFAHYRFGNGRRLAFAQGAMFTDPTGAVLGAEVAAALDYGIGDPIVVSHGIGAVSFEHHDDVPLRVVGVLARTGTPVDRTVHVTLAAMERMHDEGDHDGHDEHGHDEAHHDESGDDEAGHDEHGHEPDHDEAAHDEAGHDEAHHDEHGHGEPDRDEFVHDEAGHDEAGHDALDHDAHDESGHGEADHNEAVHDDPDHADAGHADVDGHDLVPEAITACIVGLRARPQLLAFQRFVNEYPAEPLLAVVPGVVLQRLWELVSVAEVALFAVSGLVVVAGLVGMLTMLLASVAERRREMAVLRAVGAGRRLVFGLLVTEAVLLGGGAAVLGVAVVHVAIRLARDAVLERFAFAFTGQWPGVFELAVVVAVAVTAALVAVLPAWRLYRFSLVDGLSVRA